MLVKKESAIEKHVATGCVVREYACPSTLMSFATAFIDGRYPDEKRTTNSECEEIYYVVSGSGIIHSEKGDFELSEGDMYFLEKGEVYWTEGKRMSVVLVNAPGWFFEQCKNVD